MKTTLLTALALLFTFLNVKNADAQISDKGQLVHTYSIVAKDKVVPAMATALKEYGAAEFA